MPFPISENTYADIEAVCSKTNSQLNKKDHKLKRIVAKTIPSFRKHICRPLADAILNFRKYFYNESVDYIQL